MCCLALASGVLLTLTAMPQSATGSECDLDGWFGPDCSYQCHCDGDVACDKISGVCPDGCLKGFFGPACQYETIPYTTYFPELPWLEDNDDRTCNDQGLLSLIRVAMDTAQRLTWLRLVGKEAALLHEIELKYRSLESKGEVYPCPRSQRAVVNNRTVDVSCDVSERVLRLILSGPGINSLCSLYISGGRNVAIKQDAEQSSRHGTSIASNAVDGDNGTNYLPRPTFFTTSKTCSHTKDSKNEWWRVTLRQPVNINKIRLYNRPDCCKTHLKGFTLLAQDPNNSTVFRHKNTGKDAPSGLPVYSVIPSTSNVQPVKRITVKKRPSSKALTLCEVMILGENVCPSGTFGPECERQCNCVDDQEACFVSTGGCPSGCAPGYTGEDCWTQCPEGTHGIMCSEPCNEFCSGSNNSCNPVNGFCNLVCDTGYYPFPYCTDECSLGTFGVNCAQTCSSRCLNSDCNHTTGNCKQCAPGLMGESCDQECPFTTFGTDCGQNCSSSCVDQLCHRVTGKCYTCAENRTGDFCETPMSHSVESGQETWAMTATAAAVVAVVVAIVLAVYAGRLYTANRSLYKVPDGGVQSTQQRTEDREAESDKSHQHYELEDLGERRDDHYETMEPGVEHSQQDTADVDPYENPMGLKTEFEAYATDVDPYENSMDLKAESEAYATDVDPYENSMGLKAESEAYATDVDPYENKIVA